MLVLSRKFGEKIRIGDGISITVVEIQPGKIRLGIDAPRGVSVHREEIYEKLQQQMAEAEACQNNSSLSDADYVHEPVPSI